MEFKHKFELILSALRNEIRNGTYPLGARFPSEYELAERFGVNKMTANKAVSQLVFEGYLQRGGRGSNTKVIMTEKFPKGYFVYIAPLAHEMNRLILTGIENYAFANGYSVIFYAPPADQMTSCMHRLTLPEITGILTTSYGILDVPGKNVIHLFLSLPENDHVHHTISVDSYGAGVKMMQELLARGHRKVIMFHYPYSISTAGTLWLRGVQEVMESAGIDNIADRVLTNVQYDEMGVYSELKTKLMQYPDTTAIITNSDNDALLVMKAVKRLGIPADKICVTGGGCLPQINMFQPLPTTFCPLLTLGRMGCEKLVEMKETGVPSEPIRQVMEVDLIHTELIPEIRP